MDDVKRYEQVRFSCEDEWLECRHDYVTGSQVATLMGINPWTTRDDLVAAKRGTWEEARIERKRSMAWGSESEGSNIRIFGIASGCRTHQTHAFLVSREIEGLAVTLDGLIMPRSDREPETVFWGNQGHGWSFISEARQMADLYGPGILEAKQTHTFGAKHWKDAPPEHYQVQLLAQLAVTGKEWGALMVRIGSDDMRGYVVMRDREFEEELVVLVNEFWDEVDSGV